MVDNAVDAGGHSSVGEGFPLAWLVAPSGLFGARGEGFGSDDVFAIDVGDGCGDFDSGIDSAFTDPVLAHDEASRLSVGEWVEVSVAVGLDGELKTFVFEFVCEVVAVVFCPKFGECFAPVKEEPESGVGACYRVASEAGKVGGWVVASALFEFIKEFWSPIVVTGFVTVDEDGMERTLSADFFEEEVETTGEESVKGLGAELVDFETFARGSTGDVKSAGEGDADAQDGP